ncbi:MAG TPA: hypothetical protein PK390_01380 [Fervidobacterium nodosum]|nr:hypothetical protein [Fervidobacterium nodosum]
MKSRVYLLVLVLAFATSCAKPEQQEQDVEENIVKNGMFNPGATIKYINELRETGDWYWFQNGDYTVRKHRF